jgi:hypothetical protein
MKAWSGQISEFSMTTSTASTQDFNKLLDTTAADTEALLDRLLSEQPEQGEIARRCSMCRARARCSRVPRSNASTATR